MKSGEINDTLAECFEKQGQGCKTNVMTRFFCGPDVFCKSGSKRAFEKAKQSILKHYLVVGLSEHLNLYLKVLHTRLPFFFPFVPNVAHFRMKLGEKFNSSSVPAELIEKIKQANKADVELYQFIEQLFWRQVRACGIMTH